MGRILISPTSELVVRTNTRRSTNIQTGTNNGSRPRAKALHLSDPFGWCILKNLDVGFSYLDKGSPGKTQGRKATDPRLNRQDRRAAEG